jgi:hypothetical protein
MSSSENKPYPEVLAELEKKLCELNAAILSHKDKLLALHDERATVLTNFFGLKERVLLSMLENKKTQDTGESKEAKETSQNK